MHFSWVLYRIVLKTCICHQLKVQQLSKCRPVINASQELKIARHQHLQLPLTECLHQKQLMNAERIFCALVCGSVDLHRITPHLRLGNSKSQKWLNLILLKFFKFHVHQALHLQSYLQSVLNALQDAAAGDGG